jgi:predicted DNA-binding transcriptional regulator AlpA
MGDVGKRLLTLEQVAAKYAIHPKNVPALERDGKIPKRIPGWFGKREARWLEEEIDAHIDRMAGREKAEQVA